MSIAWLWVVVGLAFFLAWNLGANDVANAMGTSVGSKAITLRQAIALAGVLELTGAVFFGREENMRNAVVNLDHNIHFILEVLERLDVTQIPSQGGKLDKLVQKAVLVESASEPDEDFDIVRSVRRGFQWRDRIVRAEEVVIKKWRDSNIKKTQPISAPAEPNPAGSPI